VPPSTVRRTGSCRIGKGFALDALAFEYCSLLRCRFPTVGLPLISPCVLASAQASPRNTKNTVRAIPISGHRRKASLLRVSALFLKNLLNVRIDAAGNGFSATRSARRREQVAQLLWQASCRCNWRTVFRDNTRRMQVIVFDTSPRTRHRQRRRAFIRARRGRHQLGSSGAKRR